MSDDLSIVHRRVVLTITFPGGTPLDIQDKVLSSIKLSPDEPVGLPAVLTSKTEPVEDDGLPRDARRVKALSEKDYWGKGWRDNKNALAITVKYPEWMPREIPPQADKKIVAAAEAIVNEYLARRLVGTDG